MGNLEILEQLELIELLLNDIPKKYQFLDVNKLKNGLSEAISIIDNLE
jgi:hypothetical protein